VTGFLIVLYTHVAEEHMNHDHENFSDSDHMDVLRIMYKVQPQQQLGDVSPRTLPCLPTSCPMKVGRKS